MRCIDVFRSTLIRFLALIASVMTVATVATAQGLPDLAWMRGGIQWATYTASFSPDGSYIVTTDTVHAPPWEGTAKLWRAAPGGFLLHTLGYAAVSAFTADGSAIAGGNGNTVNVWSVPGGTLLRTITGVSGNVACIATNGGNFAVGLDTGDVEIRSVATGALQATLHGSQTMNGGWPVGAIAWSPNGHWLATGLNNGANEVCIWHVDDSTLSYDGPWTPGTSFGPTALAFSVDNGSLYLPYYPGYPYPYYWCTLGYNADLGQWAQLGATATPGAVRSISVCPTAPGQPFTKLAVGDTGATTIYYLDNSGRPARSFYEPAITVALSPDGENVLTVQGNAYDGYDWLRVALWDARAGHVGHLNGLITPPGPLAGSPYEKLTVSANGSEIAHVDNGAVIVRNASDGAIRMAAPENTTHCPGLSPDGSVVAYVYDVPGVGANLIARRTADGTALWSTPFPGGGGEGDVMRYSPDGTRIYVPAYPSTLVLNASNGSLLTQLPGAYSLSLSLDGSLVALNHPTSCDVLRTSDWTVMQTINLSQGLESTAISLSPDGSTLLEGTTTNTVTGFLVKWDVASGSQIYNVPVGDIYSLAFSPDGTIVALSTQGDVGLQLRAVSDGSLLRSYDKETTISMYVAFSLDNRFIYFGRNDNTVACAFNPFGPGVRPNSGGNTGNVTVTVIPPSTYSASTNTQVTLSAPGVADVDAAVTFVNAHVLTATFNGGGAPVGLRNVVLSDPTAGNITFPNAFTFQQASAANLSVTAVGWPAFRSNAPEAGNLAITNSGNVDSPSVNVRLEFPNTLSWQVPVGAYTMEQSTQMISLSFYIPSVPANSTVYSPMVVLRAPGHSLDGQTLPVMAWLNDDLNCQIGLLGGLGEPLIMRLEDSIGDHADVLGDGGVGGVEHVQSIYSVYASGGTITTDFNSSGQVGSILDTDLGGIVVDWLTAQLGELQVYDSGGTLLGTIQVPFPRIPVDVANVVLSPNGCIACENIAALAQSIIDGVGLVVDVSAIALGDDSGGRYGAAQAALNKLKAWPLDKMKDVGTDNLIDTFEQLCKNNFCNPTKVITSADPNGLAGPPGFGPQSWVTATKPLTYIAQFANDADASAPAAQVITVDHLDAIDLDMASVQLGPITFGNNVVTPTLENDPPSGSRVFNASVDLRPAKQCIVQITASLDLLLGDLTWTFISIDPNTGLPITDPTQGFLDPGEGGSCQVSAIPFLSTKTGTVVQNQATITFDFNDPLNTPFWANTIDATRPVSEVQPLPATENSLNFKVSWLSADQGSGVQSVTIQVSENGGAYKTWLQTTGAGSAVFSGQPGHTYAFKSQATDGAGNVEAVHAKADASTTCIPIKTATGVGH